MMTWFLADIWHTLTGIWIFEGTFFGCYIVWELITGA